MNALTTIPATFTPELLIDDALTASWLSEATLRLRREVCWIWHQRGTVVRQNDDQLPPSIDAVSESLDFLRFTDDKQRFYMSDIAASYLSERINSISQARKIDPCPWSAIQQRLNLDDAAQFVLALALLARIDPASAAIIGACHNDAQRTAPTLALAFRLFDCADDLLTIDSAHALFHCGVLSFHGAADTAGWHQTYEVSSLIANALIHDDGRLPNELRLVKPQHTIARMNSALTAAASTLITPPATAQFIPLLGDAGTDFSEWAALLSDETGRLLVEIAKPNLPGNNRLAAIAAWCWLYDADVLLPLLEMPINEHSHDRTQWPDIPLRWYAPIQDTQITRQFPSHALKPTVVLPVTDFEMRVTRFKQVLGQRAHAIEADIREAARRFRLGAKAIEAVGRAASQSESLSAEQLHALCRSQIRLDLGNLAQAVTPRFNLNELSYRHHRHCNWARLSMLCVH